MSTILDQIVEAKKARLIESKREKSLQEWSQELKSFPPVDSFLSAIFRLGELTIIAEMKKRSPSAR